MMLAISSTPSRKYLVISLLLGCAILSSLYLSRRRQPWIQTGQDASPANIHGLDDVTLSRLSWLEGQCQSEDPFIKEYGRINIRMTRAYEGEQVPGIFTDAQALSLG